MRLLSIGNSFSHDSHKWLAQVAASCSEYLFCANLFIPGCSLKTHWEKYENNEPSYRLEINADSLRWAASPEILQYKTWDVITVQQVSGNSGVLESYEPYLTNLLEEVRKAQPDARILLHKTWAYEHDCTLEGFAKYDQSQKKMYDALTAANQATAERHGLEMIETGRVIQYLREHLEEFDYLSGGLSLCRDGFHLSHIYGRYAAALTWYAKLFGGDVRKVTFKPDDGVHDSDDALLAKVREAVYQALNEQ